MLSGQQRAWVPATFEQSISGPIYFLRISLLYFKEACSTCLYVTILTSARGTTIYDLLSSETNRQISSDYLQLYMNLRLLLDTNNDQVSLSSPGSK